MFRGTCSGLHISYRHGPPSSETQRTKDMLPFPLSQRDGQGLIWNKITLINIPVQKGERWKQCGHHWTAVVLKLHLAELGPHVAAWEGFPAHCSLSPGFSFWNTLFLCHLPWSCLRWALQVICFLGTEQVSLSAS